MTLAEAPAQDHLGGPGQLGDRPDARAAPGSSAVFSPTPHRASTGSGWRKADLLAGPDVDEPVGLGPGRAQLGQELGRPPRRPSRPAPSSAADRGPDPGPDLGGLAEQEGGAPHVEERLVERDGLHARGEGRAGSPGTGASTRGTPRSPAGRTPPAGQTPARPEARHRRVEPGGPGLVRRGHDHPARRGAPDHHGLAGQRGVLQHLDRRVERVEVHVQDGLGRAVHARWRLRLMAAASASPGRPPRSSGRASGGATAGRAATGAARWSCGPAAGRGPRPAGARPPGSAGRNGRRAPRAPTTGWPSGGAARRPSPRRCGPVRGRGRSWDPESPGAPGPSGRERGRVPPGKGPRSRPCRSFALPVCVDRGPEPSVGAGRPGGPDGHHPADPPLACHTFRTGTGPGPADPASASRSRPSFRAVDRAVRSQTCSAMILAPRTPVRRSRPPHGEQEPVEHRLGAPGLDALEDGHVGQAGAVVQGEEDDALAAAHGRGLRGDLHPGDHDPLLAPEVAQRPGRDHAQVGEQRLVERQQVPRGVEADHLELGLHPFGAACTPEGRPGPAPGRGGARPARPRAGRRRSWPRTAGPAVTRRAARRTPRRGPGPRPPAGDRLARRSTSPTSAKGRSARASRTDRTSASEIPWTSCSPSRMPYRASGSSIRSTVYDSSLRLTSRGRISMPWRRASSRMSRRGYMPGSWVRTPARKWAGQCAFSQADWYVGTANAAAWALQNPNEANCSTCSQIDRPSAAGTPALDGPPDRKSGRDPLDLDRRRPDGAGCGRRRRGRSRPRAASTFMTCSW